MKIILLRKENKSVANKNIKALSFYKSYYEALKEIPEKDKKEIIFAMIKGTSNSQTASIHLKSGAQIACNL